MKSSNTKLGIWNIYFIIKLILVVNGVIKLNFLKNIAFISFLLFPIENRKLAVLRLVIAVVLGCVIFYDDSFLPPITHLLTQFSQLSQFDFRYLVELTQRFISLDFILMLFITTVLYFMFYKVLRVSVLVIAAIIFVQITHKSDSPYPIDKGAEIVAIPNTPIKSTSTTIINNDYLNNYKKDFFAKQSNLNITFNNNLQSKSKFDILALSICSLAWEDIKYFKLENHILFKDLDILFENFNTATSYSGPALVRLLQANCGQKSHSDIMSKPSNPQCYLLNNLKNIGYDTKLILNHNGAFDNFTSVIKEKGNIETNPTHYNSKTYLLNFDNSPIQRDNDIFTQWLQSRENDATNKTFTLYNTVSLHDGVHIENNMGLASSETYKKRLTTLLDDVYGVMEGLKKSNRPIVVLLIPEHGANILGDKTQIAGMRDLPSPAITNVPVGLKIIGNNIQRIGEQQRVTQPSSYLAVAHLVSQLLEQDIFSKTEFSPNELLKNLPETPMLSENDGSTVMQYQNRYFYSYDNNDWTKYDQ